MALRFPINSGSWSNPAIWSGSLIPTSVDDVHANNRTVIIDQDVTVLSLKTTSSGSAVAGGGFTLIGDYTVNALTSGNGFVPGSSNVINYLGSGSATVIGDIRSSSTANVHTIFKSGTGFLTVSGSFNTTGGSNSSKGVFVTGSSGRLDVISKLNTISAGIPVYAITVAGTGITTNIIGDVGPTGDKAIEILPSNISSVMYLNVIGNIFRSSAGFNNASININNGTVYFNFSGSMTTDVSNGLCVSVQSSFSYITITGSLISTGTINGISPLWLTGGTNFVSISGSIINNSTNGFGLITGAGPSTIIIKDSFVSTTANFPAIANSGQMYLTLTNTVVSASALSSTISCSRSDSYVILDGSSLINGRQIPGTSKSAVIAQNMYMKPNSNTRWTMWDPTQTNQYTMYAQGFVPDSPQISDVRFGTSYLGGTLSGSMVVPNSGSVLFGVQVDNGSGSYSITADQVSEAIWNKSVSNLTGSGTIGQRLANSSTVSSTGAQIAAFGI
jgi:hypothetical protein